MSACMTHVINDLLCDGQRAVNSRVFACMVLISDKAQIKPILAYKVYTKE